MALADSIVKRQRPVPVNDGLTGQSNDRRSPYGDQAIYSNFRAALADEGSYYAFANPAIDTTVAYGVIAAFATLTPAWLVANTAQAGGRSIFMDYIKIRPTVAPASATNWKMVVEVAKNTRLSTAPTGGALLVAHNANPNYPNDLEGQVWAFSGGTVLTVVAATEGRVIANLVWRASIPVVLEEMSVQFGEGETGNNMVATVGRVTVAGPPVCIPPQCSAAFHMYGASNAITGLNAEYSLGLWSR